MEGVFPDRVDADRASDRVIGRLNPKTRLSRWLGRRYQAGLERRGWYDSAARSDAEAIFIGGCWRSGTSLLREILGRHPCLACGPESHIFALPFEPARLARQWSRDPRDLKTMAAGCATLVEFGELFFAELLESQGKQRWIDKTPQNARVAERLLTAFPRGRFLHVLRDGRDVVCSLRTYPKEDFVGGRLVPAEPMDRPVTSCARTWVQETTTGIETRGHSRHLEVRYEDLVCDQESAIRRICGFLGEDFVPSMLEPDAGGLPGTSSSPVVTARFINNPDAAGHVHSRSVGRWRRDLSRAEREEVWQIAGDLLVGLGYASDGRWVQD